LFRAGAGVGVANAIPHSSRDDGGRNWGGGSIILPIVDDEGCDFLCGGEEKLAKSRETGAAEAGVAEDKWRAGVLTSVGLRLLTFHVV
jgi:hypothetical protein